jgi:tRNA A37 threonylcarbamoyladenosine dehydratase
LGDIKKFKELAAVNVAKYFSKEDIEAKTKQFDLLLTQFAMSSCAGSFAPLSAFLGGFVAQEVIKSLTNKFTPVQQIYYSDCVEVLPTIPAEADQAAFFDQLSGQGTTLRLLGPEVAAQLEQMKLFMVGCGAIGCELLKNFAMLNIGVNGAITITDPDHIETSNLNRQFLFREKHIRKSKSQTAAAAAQQMNPQLKGKIVARLDKVHEGTESVFTD